MLDDAAYNANATATAGTVSFTSPNLTWTGDLAAGATATITFSVTVKNPDTGNKHPGHHHHLRHGRAATARPAAPTPAARRRSRWLS